MASAGHSIKRYYKTAAAVRDADGFFITLDERPVTTPGKRPLRVMNEALGDALAAEWLAQEEFIQKHRMGLNLLAYTAIDQTAQQRLSCIEELAAYGGSDLLCYRAEGPAALIARQAAAWDPLLTWVRDKYGAHLRVTSGVGHVSQDTDAVERLRAGFKDADLFMLAALRSAAGLTGSLILALALMAGRLDAPAAWAAAQVDEDWQRETWGEDEEAAARRAGAFMALGHAEQMMRLLQP